MNLSDLPPDPIFDETSCPIATCRIRGMHTHDNDDPLLPLNRTIQRPVASLPPVFHFFEEPEPDPAGVAAGYVVTWDGSPGPATATPVAIITDGRGGFFVDQTGPAEDVTVIDD